MRFALVALILLAAGTVFYVLFEASADRVERREGLEEDERRAGATTPADDEETAAEVEKGRRPRAACRLVYADGSPAGDIALRVAVGRPFRTRIYRNGDYPEKVIWLVTRLDTVRTDSKGVFRPPTGKHMVAFTETDSPAYVLAEIEAGDVPAIRRVRVTGTLRAADGGDYNRSWVAAQSTEPEDWNTRYTKEKDSFVSAKGDLGVDPAARVETLADAKARFELRVVPGRTWLVFGEHGRLGVREILVSDRDVDLGNIVVRPVKPAAVGNNALHGFVLDCAGQPRPRTEVRLWDGNVGEPSHYVYTDEKGRFECKGLQSPHVIAWATPHPRMNGPHGGASQLVYLPQQSSGTIRLPCNTPVTLTAPAKEEYLWLKPQRPGFYLFVRDGVFLGGYTLGTIDEVGLPPGNYHIVAVTPDGRIFEGDRTVIEGGDARLAATDLADTTQG